MSECMRKAIFILSASLCLSGCFFNANIEGLSSAQNSDSFEKQPDTSLVLQPSTATLSLAETDSDVLYNSSLVLQLNKAYDKDIIVHINLVDVYAQKLIDYSLSSLDVTLPAKSLSLPIPITIKGDVLGEGTESFKIQLSVEDTAISLTANEILVDINDNDPIVLQVQPLYPTAGANFFDLVTNMKTTPLPQVADVACVYTSLPSYDKCLDGGLYRKVIATGEHSCLNLTLEDNLGVYDWVCDASTDPVFFYSTGFKVNKGMKDILNSASFKANFVTLKKGTSTVASSNSLTWWTNIVSPLTLNSAGADPRLTLNTSGTIYTVVSTGASRGITLSAPRVGLVVLSGATLTATNPTSGDCYSGLAGTQQCLIELATNSDASYIEGDFIGNTNLYTIVIFNANISGSIYHTRIHNSKFVGVGVTSALNSGDTTYSGFMITQSQISNFVMGLQLWSAGQKKLLKDLVIYNNSTAGLSESINSWYSKYVNIKIIKSNLGISSIPWYALLQDVQTVNNATGISLSSNGVIIKNTLSVGNNYGMNLSNTNGVASNLTILNNATMGLQMSIPANFSTISNVLIANNAKGLVLPDSGSDFTNLFLTQNTTGIEFTSSSTGSVFKEKLILGNTTNCLYTSAGASPGLTGVDCDNQGSSTAVRTLGASALGYFTGKVTSESVNTHNTGFSVSSAITDWFRFENPFRFWGSDSATSDLLQATKGQCLGASNCQVWDSRVLSSASLVYNANGAFVSQGPCPASVHGDATELYSATPYLKYATEIFGDRIGNDNGLCESSESCIYSANIGSYQGEGSYLQNTCVFQNGVGANAVSNVKMYAYPQ